jgi:hypothetical protein
LSDTEQRAEEVRRGHRRRQGPRRAPQRAAHRRRRAPRDLHPPLLLPPPHAAGGHVPHVHRRGRHRPGPGPAAVVHAAGDPGMTVETESEVTKKAQDGVLEFLLVNHPLDCPVCDKGGECPLQDQTLAFGPGESRFVEEKRHFEKPIPISDLVYLDRERCILCDRCTRFARRWPATRSSTSSTGATQTQVNTFPDDPSPRTSAATPCRSARWARSPPGPTASRPARGTSSRSSPPAPRARSGAGWRCSRRQPGGAPTSASTSTRSTGAGCATRAGSTSRPSNSDERLGDAAGARRGRRAQEAPGPRPSRAATAALTAARDRHGPGPVAVLGGARLTNEDAYAWAKLAKGVIGTDNVDAQLGDGLPAEAVLGLPRATIDEACAAGGWSCWGPTSRRSCRSSTCGCATPWSSGASGSSSCRPTPRAHPVRRRVAALPAGRGPRAGPRSSPGPRGWARSRPGPPSCSALPGKVVCVLGRPNAGRASRRRGRGRLAAGRAGARHHVPVQPAAGQRARRHRHGPGPGRPARPGHPRRGREWYERVVAGGALRAGARRHRHPERGGRGPDPGPGAARRRPPQPTSPTATWPSGPSPAPARARRRLLRHAVGPQADVVLPATGYAEKRGTTTNIEGRISRLEQKVTRRAPPGPTG